MSTNRSTNIKETKEKRNREKLLAGPGSEFSLANPEDLELDYYDYNVTNAGAAPGSYLGMDPAYLVWIPPIDDDSKYDRSDSEGGSSTEPYYEEIPAVFRSPLSNSTVETPIDESTTLSPFTKNPYKSNESNKNLHNDEISKILAANTFNDITPKAILSQPILSASILSNECLSTEQKLPIDSIQMKEFHSKSSVDCRYSASTAKPSKISTNNGQHDEKDCGTEKETAVVKSTSNNINQHYELDNIQFADEEDDLNDVID